MESLILNSIQAALLFFIVSSPIVYNFVNKLLGNLFTVAVKGCPSGKGLGLHTIVYGVLFYLLIKINTPKEAFAFRGIVVPAIQKEKDEAILKREGGILPGGLEKVEINYQS